MPNYRNSLDDIISNVNNSKYSNKEKEKLKLLIKNRSHATSKRFSTSSSTIHKNQLDAKLTKNEANSDLSSNLSSNNLTCSDLDTTSNQTNSSNNSLILDVKLQRKKLIKCILREDLDLLKALIQKQDLTKIRDKHRNTLLHIACGFGRLKSVQFLLSVCSTLLYENDDKGHNAIDVAIKHGQIDIIKWLINSQILSDFEKICSNGQRSILHLAAKHGENEILKLICYELHKRQLSLDVKDAPGNTAAHLAAKYNHLDCLQTLVEYNCDITICNKYGHTPCFIAEFNGNNECVHYLMIVETCISLSIKVVKLSRKLRETKTNNDILKAQMDEAIAINNDFINQRENTLFISLELMQKQIQDIENKIFYEIDRLNKENSTLKQQIDQLNSRRRPILSDINNNNNDRDRQIRFDEEYTVANDGDERVNHIIDNLNQTRDELINTRNNCNQILNLDYKKMENVKSKFDQIKNYMEMNEASQNSTANANDDDIIETREHLDILRKMYQEATHKLMIFRNLIKERQKNSNYNPSKNIYSMNSESLNKFISSTGNSLMSTPTNVPDISKHHAKIILAESSQISKRQNKKKLPFYNDDNSTNNENGTVESNENSINTIIENYNYNNNNNNLHHPIQYEQNVSNNNDANDDFYTYEDENGNIVGYLNENEDYEEEEDTEFDIIYATDVNQPEQKQTNNNYQYIEQININENNGQVINESDYEESDDTVVYNNKINNSNNKEEPAALDEKHYRKNTHDHSFP